MRLLLGSLLAFAIAAVVGLGATYFALSRDAAFGALKVGAWTAWPKTGTTNADPYARANIARSGRLPIGLGDGISFSAETDDSGKTLNGRCDVLLSGNTPTARFWTLTLYGTDGQLVANSINRYGFTSQEILRGADGDFEIAIGPRAHDGNWLPTGGVDRYLLVLRLYDTAVGVSTRAGRELAMPVIETEDCP